MSRPALISRITMQGYASAGLSADEAAEAAGTSRATAYRLAKAYRIKLRHARCVIPQAIVDAMVSGQMTPRDAAKRCGCTIHGARSARARGRKIEAKPPKPKTRTAFSFSPATINRALAARGLNP